LNRSFLIPSGMILDSNVEPGMMVAAPDAPDTRPRLAASARSIISPSRAARSSAASGAATLNQYVEPVHTSGFRSEARQRILSHGGPLQVAFPRRRIAPVSYRAPRRSASAA